MTEEVEVQEDDLSPTWVAETVVAAYQWDAWHAAVTNASRKSQRVAIFTAVIATAGAAALGYDYLDAAGRLSAFVYAPVVGGGVWYLVRTALIRRLVNRVIDELRPIVVPVLAGRVDDQQLVHLVEHGTSLIVNESRMIVADRRDGAVALVASEYDLSRFPGDFSSGGGADGGGGGGDGGGC
ncbi:hypothetical protein [Aeromicrobium sp.]|uniref:hypothetical protein n=1 Tax=Aeromicrobium sp. TaxID=1871063 RepID=UPI002FCA851F